jgi:DMSO/TMAO reductase YedYZ molybdopterin-dependent catalytic subunit
MKKKMRVMSEKPLNAETPIEALRTWTTDNEVFFKRNQGQIMQRPIKLTSWKLSIDGLVKHKLILGFDEIRRMPKAELANTLECSGIKFIRSIPLEKAMDSTLLAYEMNGQPLPLKHGYPMRALALGWTGANCVKWLHKITVLDQPHEGFFMDRVYRVFQRGEDPKTGKVVKEINIKSIIVEPANAETLPAGIVPIRGAAYAGEAGIQGVDVSVDEGRTWQPARLIGPDEAYAWRHWEYLWEARQTGEFMIMARATDTGGRQQPGTARWNVLGYGNNGIGEHAIVVHIA